MDDPGTIGLGAWRPRHGCSLMMTGEGLEFSDDTSVGWHVMEYMRASYRGRRVRVRAIAKPASGNSTFLYFNELGGRDIAWIDAAGGVVVVDPFAQVTVIPENDSGFLEVTVEYTAASGVFIVGSAGEGSQYEGRGQPQWIFTHLEIELVVSESVWDLDELIVLVDAGADGGLSPTYTLFAEFLHGVLFEPQVDAAKRLRASDHGLGKTTIAEVALSNHDGDGSLFVTKFRQCSSLLEPNWDCLRQFAIAPVFEVEHVTSVRCSRYDSLWAEGKVPAPDVLKIDVQGAELMVLEGFGDLLTECLGIELEARLYPLYVGEALLGDLVTWLDDKFGFVLRRLEEQENFDGVRVEFNAWFTKRDDVFLTAVQQSKLRAISQMWGLRINPRGRQVANWYVANSREAFA